MIAVIIPAHNEARRLGHCLKAVKAASARAEAAGLAVEVLVVLDRCTDTSALVARRHGVHTLKWTLAMSASPGERARHG